MLVSKRRSSGGTISRTAVVVRTAGGIPTITALRSDIRVPGYLVIEVDGARFASLPADLASEMGLRTGLALEPDALEQLTRAAELEATHQVALRLLAARPHSGFELGRKLRVKGHPSAVVRAIIERLETTGLVDDAEFARHFARVRLSRGHGPSRIRTDLMAKGVADRIAAEAIDEVLEREQVDVMRTARRLAEKRAGQLGRLPRQTKLRRLVAFLARRGYRGREITNLVTEILDEVSV